MSYTIYTDGGCETNPGGPGGCGVVIINGEAGTEERYSFAYKSTTNNRMEMRAVIHALQMLPDNPGNIVLYSDSLYVINTLKGQWRKKANTDLWAQLDKLVKGKKIEYRWVKGHNGNMYNEICDELATQGINAAQKQTDTGYLEALETPNNVQSQQKSLPSGGAMAVAIDIPAAYKKHADMSVKAGTYAQKFGVTDACAKAIIEFYRNSRHAFKAYAALKTGGRDSWSSKKEDDLLHEFGPEAVDSTRHILPDVQLATSALRWYGRGLALDDAIRKVLVDQEIRENAVKQHYT